MRIDLHTHSFRSDGTESPQDLLASAARAGLDVVGLTDHDTISGWEDAAAAVAHTGVALVRGMEFTSRYGEFSVHVLGYLFDPAAPEIERHIAQMAKSRRERAQKIVERLAQDFPITWGDVLAVADPAAPIGRPHIADALIAKKIVADRQAAFQNMLSASSPYYVRQYAPQTSDVISWINQAGGRAVIAHPLANRGSRLPEVAVADLAATGLFGVEVNHRDNPIECRAELSSILAEHGLAEFGSSDYHGTGKPNQLGENTTAVEVFTQLVSGTHLEVIYP
ncbi:MAG: PHP domain-containing protein [Trueperella sp.]|nr:PHP domain-containing protein [Trueperella sp.]